MASGCAFAGEHLGFTSTFLPGPDLLARSILHTDGERFDVVFDATGNAASMRQSIDYVGQGGVLVYVGVVRDEISFAHPEFHRREMMLIGSRNAVKADFDHVAESIRDGRVPDRKARDAHDHARRGRRRHAALGEGKVGPHQGRHRHRMSGACS